jgi:hypothetical protein
VRKRFLLTGLAILLGVLAWYWFRPELLFIDARVDEKPIEAAQHGEGVVLGQGRFHAVAHESAGTATIQQLSDGRRVLRFTEFTTSNGPALYVYLIAADDARDSATVSRVDTVDLGQLKGNTGDQNYELPADVDLAKYRAVTVWCRRFSVNFATAPLTMPSSRPT